MMLPDLTEACPDVQIQGTQEHTGVHKQVSMLRSEHKCADAEGPPKGSQTLEHSDNSFFGHRSQVTLGVSTAGATLPRVPLERACPPHLFEKLGQIVHLVM